ncbi:hypothetical protein [Nocardia rhizosphaerae]|uniref:Uncharacterized protein n=1 Tax=Nocardia rhizosphaerae TaxID=1691571 RepID=A0ABV8L697_9NOCA
MNHPIGPLRILALPLIVGGIAAHLWLGSMAGLAVAGIGFGVHVAVAALGSRWLRHRDRRSTPGAEPASPASRQPER